MFISRHRMKALFVRVSLILVASFSFQGACLHSARAQQPAQTASPSTPSSSSAEARTRGIALYNQNETEGAIKALREAVKKDKRDAEAWYFLGLALNRADQYKEARKALESAVRLRPQMANAHSALAYAQLLTYKLTDAVREANLALSLDAKNAEAHYTLGMVALAIHDDRRANQEAASAISIKPNFAAAWLLKTHALANLYFQDSPTLNVSREARLFRLQQIKEAVSSLEQYLKLNPAGSSNHLWRDQLESLRVYAELADNAKPDSERTVFSPREVTTKAVIVSRVEPQYTDAARDAGVEGSVLLRAILTADGAVRHIMVAHPLSHGLTEEAIRAARQIRFFPAQKDGRAVGQYVLIEYRFGLY